LLAGKIKIAKASTATATASERARATRNALHCDTRACLARAPPEYPRSGPHASAQINNTQITHAPRLSYKPRPSALSLLQSSAHHLHATHNPTTLTQHHTQTLFQPPTSLIMTGRKSSPLSSSTTPWALPGAVVTLVFNNLLTRLV
jgi:hypothetical protein